MYVSTYKKLIKSLPSPTVISFSVFLFDVDFVAFFNAIFLFLSFLFAIHFIVYLTHCLAAEYLHVVLVICVAVVVVGFSL